MGKRSFRIAAMIVGATLALLVAAGLYAYLTFRAYPDQPGPGQGAVVEVEIVPGMSFPRIAQLLADKKLITRPTWFRLYAMSEGATTKVKSGHYKLKDNQSPAALLRELLAGVKAETVKVTLPEGKHMLEYFDLLAAAGVITPAGRGEIEAMARDRGFLEAHGIAGETVDGYLFPETYDFRIGESPQRVLERLIDQHRKVWNQIISNNAKGAQKIKERLGWSDHQFLIMASIVEKEAVAPVEQPRIAQVFINRLTSPTFRPKRLETDPTIRYGCMVSRPTPKGCDGWDPSDRLRRKQLDDTTNLYNTYQHEGLPPGPICNPGRGAIAAVANPDGSEFFFFVAKNDGTHVFSRTIAEHRRYVDQYQR